MTTPPLILASQSPRRRLLLKQIGLKFTVRRSATPERLEKHQSPARNAKRIALEKATDVAKQVRKGIVVGADTIVVVGDRTLGKPRDREEARRMLRLLSDREHLVYTAFALVDAATFRHAVHVEKTKVRFRRLEEDEIEDYVMSGAPMDKAGAYGIQDDYGAVFVERVAGCFYNVVGFPLAQFYVTLQKFLEDLDQPSRSKRK